jgi:iron(III) transport system substrate-binding protein
MSNITRRSAIAGGATAGLTLGFGLRPAFAQSKELGELAAAAAKKPPVIWSESSSDEQMKPVIDAFNKRYPDIKVQFIRNTGGNTLAARVVQESQAGTAPASLLTGDHQQFEILRQRGLVVERDWKPLGVDASLTPKPHLIATSAAIAVLVWNKNRVKEADIPRNYMDLVDPKWSGKVGSWVRAPNIVSLAKMEGEAKIREFTQKLVENKARMYDSTYQLAQEIGSGEIDVGLGLYHTSLIPMNQGAPIAWGATDPLGVATIFSAVVNKGANPEGGQVIAAWLGTAEGANAYEAGTGRGNPAVAGSRTSEVVKGRRISEFSIDETPTYIRLLAEFNKTLSDGRGRK